MAQAEMDIIVEKVISGTYGVEKERHRREVFGSNLRQGHGNAVEKVPKMSRVESIRHGGEIEKEKNQ